MHHLLLILAAMLAVFLMIWLIASIVVAIFVFRTGRRDGIENSWYHDYFTAKFADRLYRLGWLAGRRAFVHSDPSRRSRLIMREAGY